MVARSRDPLGCRPSPENAGISEDLYSPVALRIYRRIDHHQGVETLDRLFPNQATLAISLITERIFSQETSFRYQKYTRGWAIGCAVLTYI